MSTILDLAHKIAQLTETVLSDWDEEQGQFTLDHNWSSDELLAIGRTLVATGDFGWQENFEDSIDDSEEDERYHCIYLEAIDCDDDNSYGVTINTDGRFHLGIL